jgi:hypothetical protein
MFFAAWAKKWDIPNEAIKELTQSFGLTNYDYVDNQDASEASITNIVRVEASKKGCRLWRNNVGATKTENGWIRYGLANESGKMNKYIKSADLIGIRPVLITQEHLGATIGQFISREVKAANWTYKNTEHERAQLRWIELITGLGGDACFTNKEGSL